MKLNFRMETKMKGILSAFTFFLLSTASLLPAQENGALATTESELIDILIRYGSNPDGLPALHYAIKVGDVSAVQLLLDHGADANALANRILLKPGRDLSHLENVSVLSVAAIIGDLGIMDMLIKKGAAIKYEYPSDKWYRSPIYLAVSFDRPEVVAYLVAQGALGHFADPEELNLLIREAVCQGSINVLQWFKNEGVDMKRVKPYNVSLLELAITTNQPRTLRFLLDEGLDSNIGRDDGTLLPLHYAASLDCLEVVELLIKYGADVNALDKHKNSPLICAVGGAGHSNAHLIVNALVDAGADVDFIDPNPIMILITNIASYNPGCISGYKRCAEVLIKKGTNINATDLNKKTALFHAKQLRNKEWIDWLVAHGAKE